jgi:hypothetical protein
MRTPHDPAVNTIVVRSIPMGDPENPSTLRYLDCTECGPLGITLVDDVQRIAADHLETHGLDATELREGLG